MATYDIVAGERTETFRASVIAGHTGISVAEAKALKRGETIQTESEDVKTAFDTLGTIGTVTTAIAEP